MTVVAGYIRMLLKDRAGPLSDQQRRLLEEAEKSCGRLTALLTEVSDLSNLEAGTAPFNRAPTDLRALLLEAQSRRCRSCRIGRRHRRTDRARPGSVEADPVRLRAAFIGQC